MSKKLVAYFSAGGVTKKAAETIQELVPAAVVKDGRLLNGRIHTEELKKWADSFEK